MRVDRTLVAGIGASVALAAGCAGLLVLPPAHAGNSDGRPVAAVRQGPAVAVVRQGQAVTVARTGQAYTKATPLPAAGSQSRQQSSPSSSAGTTRRRVRRHHLFVGVAVKGRVLSGVRSFARATRARIAMVEIYTRFGAPLPELELHRVISTGASPLMQWNPRGPLLPRIATGAYDKYLRDYAMSVKRFGHRIVLSFGHEMNGTWNSWGAGHVRPSTFVAAWRRIHHIFATAGVHNVTWSWDPSHVGELPRPWWPGRHYVNKIGIDGYLRPGQTFARIFAARLAYIRRFTSKPIYIAETSVAPNSHQARQITGLFRGVQRYHLSGFVWFDINHLEAWRLEGRRAAIRAFRRAVARTRR